MIVNRKQAEEAWALLTARAGFGSGEPLEELDKAGVADLYRQACKTAHPDGGGTLEAFAAVDRAKHVLLEWIAKQGDSPPPMDVVKCGNCDGKGNVTIKSQRGFKITELRHQCRKCNGTGEEGVEHDKGDWG